MSDKKRIKFTGIAEQLRQAVIASGLSSYRIAKDSGVSSTAIDRFKHRERTLTIDSAAKVAEVLGLELSGKK